MGSMIQKTITLAANTPTQISSKKNSRKYLGIINLGTGVVHLGVGVPAVVNAGWPLDPPVAFGGQGGGIVYEDGEIPSQEVNAVSATGATVIIQEMT
ncbi:MAG TPA: hypothetical protein VGU72_04260 [Beijerinckiaceae bacterium]|jgi:hypothetical protein|nr:hypothetical protein [Beijerinckiaceae bacterium]